MGCLILFKSVTYAQSAQYHLTQRRINTAIIRKPTGLQGNGCGYAIKIKCSDLAECVETLSRAGINYISIWRNVGLEWVKIDDIFR